MHIRLKTATEGKGDYRVYANGNCIFCFSSRSDGENSRTVRSVAPFFSIHWEMGWGLGVGTFSYWGKEWGANSKGLILLASGVGMEWSRVGRPTGCGRGVKGVKTAPQSF